VLARVIRERKEDALRRGEPWEESAFLFTTRAGQRFDLANVAKAFQRVLPAMTPDGQDRPKHSIYDLRHTFATTLLAKGVPITYVAAQMGHADADQVFSRVSPTLFWAWLGRHGAGSRTILGHRPYRGPRLHTRTSEVRGRRERRHTPATTIMSISKPRHVSRSGPRRSPPAGDHAPRAPWQTRSESRECLDHVMILSKSHLRQLLPPRRAAPSSA
jgi:hypothetical protein